MGVCVVLVVAITGCGGDAASPADSDSPGGVGAAASPPGDPARIEIVNFKYLPTPLTVAVGQEITVVNSDVAIHTITAGDKSFDSGDLAKDEAYALTLDKVGTYDYICDIHQYMTGSIEVVPAP